jgi:hypothetical protein
LNSALTGRSLQSLPGGVCAASPAAAQSLIAAADDLARSLKANYLLLRDSRQAWPESGLETVEAHRGIRSNLPGDVEEAWKGLRKDVRYHIRNGKKQGGVEIVLDTCRSDDLYTALLSFSHEMGTPLFGKRFTENVLRAFPHESQIAVAYHQQQPVGGYLNLVLNGRLFGLWGGSLYAVRPLKVTHQVYWALIEDAIQAGYTQIDMGRSAHPSSQYDFKVQWGNETYPIYQLYRVYQGDTPAAVRVSASSQPRGQFGRFRHMWQRLPRPLARVLGPQVRRHIPFG